MRGTVADDFPLGVKLWIVAEAAKALDYAHRRRGEDGRPLSIVHRDVSPQNILLAYEGAVKVADFGIARADEQGLGLGEDPTILRGKFAYMSPEQVARAPLSAASDQFALGVVLYELIKGVRPYVHDSPLVVLDMIREAVPPDMAGIDEDVAELSRTCLARTPRERFSSTEALARALFVLRRLVAPASTLDLAEWVRGRLAHPVAATDRPIETRPLTDV